jgi:hypothetical protein
LVSNSPRARAKTRVRLQAYGEKWRPKATARRRNGYPRTGRTRPTFAIWRSARSARCRCIRGGEQVVAFSEHQVDARHDPRGLRRRMFDDAAAAPTFSLCDRHS